MPPETTEEMKRRHIKEWARNATVEKGKKKQRRRESSTSESDDSNRSDKRRTMEELSAAAAAVLRQQSMASSLGNNTSILEGIKILERRRPTQKFTGEDKSIDFEDHLSQFKKAINLPGVPASFKLAETKEWFDGLARVQISRYLRRDDHEEALKEAMEKLKSEHGSKAASAEEMLEELLKGGPIDQKDAIGLNKLISGTEGVYFLAEETDRASDFNRKSLFKTVLDKKIPHLKGKWANEIAKAQLKGKDMNTFEEFLKFLTMQKRVAAELQELEGEKKEKKEEETEFTTVSRKREQYDSYKGAVTGNNNYNNNNNNNTNRGRQNIGGNGIGRNGITPRCSECKGNHWLEDCREFRKLTPDERYIHCFERMICTKCLRGVHKPEECRFVAICTVCGKDHNSWIHGEAVLGKTKKTEGKKEGTTTT